MSNFLSGFKFCVVQDYELKWRVHKQKYSNYLYWNGALMRPLVVLK